MDDRRDLYNYLAKEYDLRQRNPYTCLLRKHEEKLIKKFSSGLVLDLGCGTGHHLNFCKNSIGLDISNKMLLFAKERGRPLIQASIEDIPIKSAFIDTVLCFYSTLNFTDLSQSVKEISRIVKRGGKIILSVISVNDMQGTDKTHSQKIKKFRLHGKRVSMRVFEKADIVEAFEKSGFGLELFDSIFRLQKAKWGKFKISSAEKLKLKAEKLSRRENGGVYLFVFEKII